MRNAMLPWLRPLIAATVMHLDLPMLTILSKMGPALATIVLSLFAMLVIVALTLVFMAIDWLGESPKKPN